MAPYFTDKWLSPGALYREGRALKRELDDSRRRIAELFGGSANEIVFTASGTESINLAIRGVAFASQHRGHHLITTQIEHRAVLDTMRQLERQGWQVTYLPVDGDGLLNPADLASALTDATTLISIMWANNEVGTIQPLAELVRMVRDFNPSIAIHSDVVAAAGYLPLDVTDLGVDMVSISAHKLGGPKGAGLLWVRRGVLQQPIITGDDRERGRRAGMENVPAIVGIARALEIALPAASTRAEHVGRLCDQLLVGVPSSVPGAVITGHRTQRAPHIASFCFERVDGEALLQQLDVQGIAAASGSACASATLDASHVLKAMAVPTALAEGNLRLSLGPENTDTDVQRVLTVLPGAIERMRALRGR
jgi:cysteine desulfurase